MNGEASNGSSINADLTTSLFEVMKMKWLAELNTDVEIDEVCFPMTSKATAKNGDEADVDYLLEIMFMVNIVKEKVLCY